MVHAAVGVSSQGDAVKATTDAVAEAKRKLGDVTETVALVFAASSYNQADVLKTARATVAPGTKVLGSSTAGEISQQGSSGTSSVVVMLLATDASIPLGTAFVPGANEAPEEKGVMLGTQLAALVPEAQKLVLLFSDGLTVNPSAVLRGMHTALPEVPVAGGSAGDDGHYKQTFQYAEDQVLSSAVSALIFGGDLKFSIGVRHGWNPISTPKKVTKSVGTVIHEINNRPAIALYEEYIGKAEAATLKEVTLGKLALSYPLGIKDSRSGEMMLRAPFYVDAQGSITCGGEVLEGSDVQLMMGTKESAVEAAKHSAEQALAGLGGAPKAAIIFSCHVRDTLYATREQSMKEIEAIQAVIGHEVPMAGFYTYAEQAPIDDQNYNIKSCNNANHNETIVIVLLGE